VARILVILEVSRKQDYIFGNRGMGLKEYMRRSRNISEVTGVQFFRTHGGQFYREEENLVYSGGGHAVLQFGNRERAASFVAAVTLAAMKHYWGMELFAKQMPYEETRTPGENLEALFRALERKKSVRAASFRQLSFGVEKLNPGESFRPMVRNADYMQKNPPVNEDRRYIRDFDKLKSGMIAVVHVDGNAMGSRVLEIYAGEKEWEGCCARMRQFSRQVQQDFEEAFQETVDRLSEELGHPEELPIRPIILAGDDVCFVTDGPYGLECARVFIQQLSNKKNMGRPYAACAGVSIVSRSAPFDLAYSRAEALCANAKRFSARIDPAGSVSAMDWQIEAGQIKGTLSERRKGYDTEDGGRLELRPVALDVPEAWNERAQAVTGGVRTYSFIKAICLRLGQSSLSRAKLFKLKDVLWQGEEETEFSVRLWRMEEIFKCLPGGRKELFAPVEGTRRCLIYDAIEQAELFSSRKEVEP